MQHIKPKSLLILLLGNVLCLLVGCFEPYTVRLFNLSGSSVSVLVESHTISISNLDSAVLYDDSTYGYITLSSSFKIKADGKEFCYQLININQGGYTERTRSGDVVVRLKLTEHKKIYAYHISKPNFNLMQHVGEQPDGYPISPKNCEG
ncbi:MAG: hypothetical protein ACR2P9_03100 [Gammaproteobacteria bacterium]